jgi:hypothetical protein
MHAILLGMFMVGAPAPQVPAASQAAIVTKLDAVKALAAQAERLVRSGGLDLPSTNVTRELELAISHR